MHAGHFVDSMLYRMRSYNFDNDLHQAQRFLWEIFKTSGKHFTWVPTRLENERHGPCGDEDIREDDSKIRIWEYINDKDPMIVALTILEPNGIFWMNVHPDHHDLVREIIPALEEQRRIRKIIVTVVGITVLIIGIFLIFLPGPALIVIPTGLLI